MKNISFSLLSKSDLCKEWVDALNDTDIVAYSEQRTRKHTLSSQRKFIENKIKDRTSETLVFYNQSVMLGIGEISSINTYHQSAEISYLIIDKTMWGNGLGTFIVKSLTDYAFNKLKIIKLHAGIYAENIGSMRVLEKNGFIVEGIQKDHLRLDNTRTDKILFGKKS